MKNIKVYLPGFILFVLSAALSLFIFKDYGVSWDEITQREIGYVSYDYVFHNDQKLNNYIERDHGVGFEMPLVMLEKAFHLTDSRDIYLMRHLVQNLFFLCSMFIGYIFILRLFKSQFLACFGFVMLVLTPRMFAHSFFNSKDIPFMCMSLISLAACAWAFWRDKPLPYLILGLVLGYTTSIRLLSITLTGFIGLFFLIDIIRAAKDKKALLRKLSGSILFLVGFCLALYAWWPTLWYRPLYNFVEAYKSLSKFRWFGEVLLNGKVIQSSKLPWSYLPIWFGITVPILWLLLGFTGIVFLLVAFVKQPMRYIANTRERNFLLFFLTFVTPVIMVIAMHSVVYDDWRHVYFIYPSFVLLAILGMCKLMQTKAKMFVGALCLVQVALLLVSMVRLHPYEHVYFNGFVSKSEGNLRKKYELDYWGTSNKEAMEYILTHDTSQAITVNDGPTQTNNLLLLPANDRKRIRAIVDDEAPDYIIRLFRTEDIPMPADKKVYDINVMNSTILSVYKMKEN